MLPQDTNQNGQFSQQVEAQNPLAVMHEGEQVIFELKRHPIGILIIYVMTGILLIVLAVAVFGVAPTVAAGSKEQITTFGGLAFAVFALLCLLFNWITTVVYWGNRWILTDDSITQVTRTSLFRKESSQLGLESLEDVTAEQNGILTHIFNYGVLKAETAGHRSKFVFVFCPNPTEYAQKILEAREKEDLERRQYGPNEDNSPPQPAQYQQSPPPPTAAYQPPSDPTRPAPPNNSGGFNSNY